MVRVLQKPEPIGCGEIESWMERGGLGREREREIGVGFKDLAHVILEAGQSKTFRAGNRREAQGRIDTAA